jgi:uncharacterized membrane protein
MTSRKLIPRLGFLATVMVTWASPSSAGLIIENIQNATFYDGGVVAGFFTFDTGSGSITDWVIRVSGGDTATFPAVVYTPANSTASSRTGDLGIPLSAFDFDLKGSNQPRQLRLLLEESLPLGGGIDPFHIWPNGEIGHQNGFECFACAPFRNFATGSVVGTPVSASQTYVQFSPGSTNFATGINEKGEVVGEYGDVDPPGHFHGFVRDPNGTITTFDPPGSASTFAFGINDEGAITGYYRGPSGVIHGYVRDPEGNFTTFDPPGSIATHAFSINAGGAITGSYNEANLVNHGFVRSADGTLISFDPPGSISTRAVSINSTGTITGDYVDANQFQHGFVRQPGGAFVSFDPPMSTQTSVASINDAGAITGQYFAANGRAFGFVRDPEGKITSFDPGFNTQPTSINNEGAITGSYQDIDQIHSHGFVRSLDGTITLFDDAPFCTSFPTSINDEGVITGSCAVIGAFNILWVRFP